MLELRRRVQADPASIAFAQLAEECRRLGSNEEAAEICRAGLVRNPGYFSARVTLGRALIELGQLDEAKAELETVVAGAPDNLAAIRGLAEILQRRGQMKDALEYYKRALELARHDPDLEDTVERISQAVAPAPPPQTAGPQVSIEDIFDFDKLIGQLGLPPEPPASASAVEGGFGATSELANETVTSEGGPDEIQASDVAPSLEELFAEPIAEPALENPVSVASVMLEQEAPFEDFFAVDPPASEGETASASAAEGGFGATSPELVEELPTSEGGPELANEIVASEGGLDSVDLALDDADSLAVIERELRELDEQRSADERRARVELAERRRAAMVFALETWLSAIVAAREQPGSAG